MCVRSCLFPNAQDANFSRSVAGCIWPRAAIAAGSFWGFNNATKALDGATFNATHARLVARGIPSCPCASLDHTGCSQLDRCGEAYCVKPPPAPTPPTPAPASCGKAPAWTCLFSVKCDPTDADQAIAFDAATGMLTSASGLCADAGAACKHVSTLALAKCDASSATQKWTHNAKGANRFASVGCKGQCIDCYGGGVGNPGLYNCDGASNQDWVPNGKTFSEDYAGLECMSQAPQKTAASLEFPIRT